MDDLTGELVRWGEFEHYRPAVVDVFDDGEGWLDGERRVRELRPGVLIVGLDGGFVFCEAKPETDECVHVGIGNVMDELTDGPATFAIRGVELVLAQCDERSADVAWEITDLGDRGLPFGIVFIWSEGKSPNREARV